MVYVWISGLLSGIFSYYAKGKSQKFWNAITLVLIVLFMSCNNFSGDEINMYHNYYNESLGIRESSILFYILADICREEKISFGWFNFITISAALILIASTLSRYVKAWGFVIALYFIAGAILDTSLYRQFLASAFIIYGFRYLLDSSKHAVKYIICVFFASAFHIAMLSYIVFALIALNEKQRKRVMVITAILGGMIVGATLLNNKVIPGISLVAKFVKTDSKLSNYVSIASGRFGWLSMVALCAGCIFVTKVMMKMLKHRTTEKESIQRDSMSAIFYINIVSVIFIPFCIMYFSSFSRLFRSLIWINLMALVMVAEKIPIRKLNMKWLCCAAGYVTYVFVLYNLIIFDWNQSEQIIFEGTFFWT